MDYLSTPVINLSGVGKTRAQQLERLGINTIHDLIYFFPRAYENRGYVKKIATAVPGENASFVLTVGTSVQSTRIRGGLTISKFRAFDETGSVEIVFFNSPYIKTVFSVGAEFRFYGKISNQKRALQMQSPKYEPFLASVPLADFIPVYPKTEGISSKYLNKLISSVIDEAASRTPDYLPEKIRLNNSLPTLSYAIRNIHFPKDEESLRKSLARFAFDEMFIFGLGISLNTHHKKMCSARPFSPCSLDPLLEKLPYELTLSQKNAVNDIYKDTVRKSTALIPPMSRIVVGDVGSGKTIVAAMGMYICVKSHYQAALMVPTEILAHQHYAEMHRLFSELGIKCELLIGQTTQKEKRRIYASLEDGSTDIVIGTHALISDKVKFKSLGLVITDEQHRFGVAQRALLKEKSEMSHLLVMSATPIPRTLALTMYGDLDVSKITEMPKGRIKTDTYVVDESYRARLNDFIKKQILLGGQCYVVCPSIEKTDEGNECIEPNSLNSPFYSTSSPLKNAVEYSENLKAIFPDLSIECLHGKMKGKEKDEIMHDFASGKINILVSTTVIEVGINVPNATLMVVENAERFGLSQLHQLRGRVGRGTKKSYCVLVSDAKNDTAKSRLEVMRSTSDGYEIAEKDLLLRGPGDFFSQNRDNNLRQSGGFSFKFATLCDDNKLMEGAFSSAKELAAADPTLTDADNALIRARLSETFTLSSSTIS